MDRRTGLSIWPRVSSKSITSRFIICRQKINEFISDYMIILSFHFQAVLYILVEGMGMRRLTESSNIKTKNGNFSEILSAHERITVQSKWDQPSSFLVDMMEMIIQRKKLSIMIFYRFYIDHSVKWKSGILEI